MIYRSNPTTLAKRLKSAHDPKGWNPRSTLMQEAILAVKRVVETDKDFGDAQEVVEGVMSRVGVEMLKLLAKDVDEKEKKTRMGMIWRWDAEDMELLLALREVLQVKIDVAMIMVREREERERKESERKKRKESSSEKEVSSGVREESGSVTEGSSSVSDSVLMTSDDGQEEFETVREEEDIGVLEGDGVEVKVEVEN
jgi:hypothetical protein